MIKAYQIGNIGFNVLNWEEVHKTKFFSIPEIVCLHFGQSPKELIAYLEARENQSLKEVIRVRQILKSVTALMIEKMDEDGLSTRFIRKKPQQEDDVYSKVHRVIEPLLIERESLKAFYCHYFPNDKPYYLFPEETKAIKRLEELQQEEIKQLKQEVKQLSKLVVAFAVGGLGYKIPAKANSIAGLDILKGTFEDTKEVLSKNNKTIDIAMTDKTLSKYLVKALKEIGIEVRP